MRRSLAGLIAICFGGTSIVSAAPLERPDTWREKVTPVPSVPHHDKPSSEWSNQGRGGDEPDRWDDRPWSLAARTNLSWHLWPADSPDGWFGVRVARMMAPGFAIELGAGYPTSGTALGVWRLAPSRAFVLAMGLGGAIGHNYQQFDPAQDHAIHVYHSARWLLAETGVELRMERRWLLRLDLRVAALLNPSDFECQSPTGGSVRPCTEDHGWDHASRAYRSEYSGLGMAVGYAF